MRSAPGSPAGTGCRGNHRPGTPTVEFLGVVLAGVFRVRLHRRADERPELSLSARRPRDSPTHVGASDLPVRGGAR